ncbi:hypothetical protein A2U01_0105640, partial [Trifolium medium]|nr:hypothetical protein [Trifolium medium]
MGQYSPDRSWHFLHNSGQPCMLRFSSAVRQCMSL